MANTFIREPIVNGDNDAWAPYLLVAVRRDEGVLSCELYNDSGTLKLSKGKLGINDGTNRGAVELDTISTISLVGLTASRWAQIEASVSGAAVTIAITSIAAGTDESTIPAAIKAAYDYEKQGYYVTATKRIIGIAFIRAAGTLGRVVNCESGKFGFKNIKMIEYQTSAGVRSFKYIAEERFDYGPWNMDTATTVDINMPFVFTTIRHVRAFIQSAGASKNILEFPNGDPPVPAGGIYIWGANQFQCTRDSGGYYDGATFNASTVYITVEYET